jgi:hypothetical protein
LRVDRQGRHRSHDEKRPELPSHASSVRCHTVPSKVGGR